MTNGGDVCRYSHDSVKCTMQSISAVQQRDWHRVLLCLRRALSRGQPRGGYTGYKWAVSIDEQGGEASEESEDATVKRPLSSLSSSSSSSFSSSSSLSVPAVSPTVSPTVSPPAWADGVEEDLDRIGVRLDQVYGNMSDAFWYIGNINASLQHLQWALGLAPGKAAKAVHIAALERRHGWLDRHSETVVRAPPRRAVNNTTDNTTIVNTIVNTTGGGGGGGGGEHAAVWQTEDHHVQRNIRLSAALQRATLTTAVPAHERKFRELCIGDMTSNATLSPLTRDYTGTAGRPATAPDPSGPGRGLCTYANLSSLLPPPARTGTGEGARAGAGAGAGAVVEEETVPLEDIEIDRSMRIGREILSFEPRVEWIHGLLTDAEINYIVAQGRDLLAPSTLLDKDGSMTTNRYDFRSSLSAWLDNDDAVVARVGRRVRRITGLSLESAEMLHVGRYKAGAMYKPHCDWDTAGKTGEKGDGERIATVLTVLEPAEIGGSTIFLRKNLNIRPLRGDAIFW